MKRWPSTRGAAPPNRLRRPSGGPASAAASATGDEPVSGWLRVPFTTSVRGRTPRRPRRRGKPKRPKRLRRLTTTMATASATRSATRARRTTTGGGPGPRSRLPRGSTPRRQPCNRRAGAAAPLPLRGRRLARRHRGRRAGGLVETRSMRGPLARSCTVLCFARIIVRISGRIRSAGAYRASEAHRGLHARGTGAAPAVPPGLRA